MREPDRERFRLLEAPFVVLFGAGGDLGRTCAESSRDGKSSATPDAAKTALAFCFPSPMTSLV